MVINISKAREIIEDLESMEDEFGIEFYLSEIKTEGYTKSCYVFYVQGAGACKLFDAGRNEWICKSDTLDIRIYASSKRRALSMMGDELRELSESISRHAEPLFKIQP